MTATFATIFFSTLRRRPPARTRTTFSFISRPSLSQPSDTSIGRHALPVKRLDAVLRHVVPGLVLQLLDAPPQVLPAVPAQAMPGGEVLKVVLIVAVVADVVPVLRFLVDV